MSLLTVIAERVAGALGVDAASINALVAQSIKDFPELQPRADWLAAELAKLVPDTAAKLTATLAGFAKDLALGTAAKDPEAFGGSV